MLTYEEVTRQLFEISSRRGMNPGLKNARYLSEALARPEKSFPSIHVAGTNGKGSLTTKIGKALELSGYKVGVYTSPHLFSFRERIAVNGEPISEDSALSGLKKIYAALEGLSIEASFFEILTLLAFDFFRLEKVDVAVIETGLGGRLDATNIITPLLSVITSISEDHMPLLGSTLEEIAFEKAGIIKERVPVVIGPYADFSSIRQKAAELKAPLVIAKAVEGDYDKENNSTAREALLLLKRHFFIPDACIEKGLEVRPCCRFEEIEGVIFDVAHNVCGFKALFKALSIHFQAKPIRVVVGLSKEKDREGCLTFLTQHASFIHLVEADSPRAATLSELAKILDNLGYSAYSKEYSIKEALLKGKEAAEKLVVCGTFFIMKEAKEALGSFHPVNDAFDLNERSFSKSSKVLT